ncbi:MAG TPA: dihydrofolate reductase [Candidatus Binatia bacterium]|nr:dihydrofolate reductase [Candidatus Binatia bacterium]
MAMDKARGIGINGQIPWHLPSDLARFKRITLNHPILMGRKTHQSIGRMLPGRRNIVLSHDPNFIPAPGCERAASLDDALAVAGDGEVFVIGGGGVYAEALARAQRIYLTLVDDTFEADTHFPPVDDEQWIVASRLPIPADEKNSIGTTFITLERAAR